MAVRGTTDGGKPPGGAKRVRMLVQLVGPNRGAGVPRRPANMVSEKGGREAKRKTYATRAVEARLKPEKEEYGGAGPAPMTNHAT